MSLESFYGGKQGISPVIRKNFKYVTTDDLAYKKALAVGEKTAEDLKKYTMEECFKDSTYKQVWYNELCIIDSPNKNDENNGKLFRRTLKGQGSKQSGDSLCAEYIGKISGPAGTNPIMAFHSIGKVNKKAHGDEDGDGQSDWSDSTLIAYPANENVLSTDLLAEDTHLYVFNAPFGNEDEDDNVLVPGAIVDPSNELFDIEKDEQFNDTIQYTWFNLIDPSDEISKSIVYLGFRIPYPCLHLTVETVSANESASITKRTSGNYKKRNFFHSWNLKIPRGPRGNELRNLRLVQLKNFKQWGGGNKPILYDFEKDLELATDGSDSYIWKNKTSYGPDIDAGSNTGDRYAWVYDYKFYEDANTSNAIKGTYSFYLGLYKEIFKADLAENGQLTFYYTDGTSSVTESNTIKWINNISLNSNNGEFKITYNTGEPSEWTLPFIEKATIDNQGQIKFSFTDNSSKILYKDNDGANEETPFRLTYINNLSMNPDTKVLSYKKANEDNNSHELNNGKGINYIEDMVVDDRSHLMVYYSSTQYRPTEASLNDSSVSSIRRDNRNVREVIWNKKVFREFVTYYDEGTQNYVTDGDRLFWQDLGLIREVKKGIRVFKQFNFKNLPDSIKNLLNNYNHDSFLDLVLNQEKWGDNLNPYYMGEGIEEGTFAYASEVEGGSAYFYDRETGRWAYAGSWSDTSDKTDIKIKVNDESHPYLGDKDLSDEGVVFNERSSHEKVNSLLAIWKVK